MKVIVLSHFLFDKKMEELGLDDNNVENTNMAFISIIGTEECIKYWIMEDDKHYFKDHPNVLNLEFDDIGDIVIYNGHTFRTMNMEEAEKTVDFIERMINNKVDTIYIHCKAGMSRSRAIAEFIYRYCNDNDIELEYDDRDYYTTVLNSAVLRSVSHAYYKKHSLMMYSEGNVGYPKDLIDREVRIINR